ncbi:hypothetical protein YC2023_119625 [Brassica napus]
MEDAISRPCGVRIRDPRANHAAAKMRLKEDEFEANNSTFEERFIVPLGRFPVRLEKTCLHHISSLPTVAPGLEN